MNARHFSPVSARHYKELYKLIVALEDEKEAEALLKDILTPQELATLAGRWQEVQLLAKGIPQRDIAEILGISISKITRGSRALQYGTGGLGRMLKKMGKPVQIHI
ncbi:MAG: Trp family transcriptional regulator [Candidatus Peribacter sp.]|jgi:Trp operon repressor